MFHVEQNHYNFVMFHVEHFLPLCYNTCKGVNKMETNENNTDVLGVLNELLEKVTTLQTSFNEFTAPKEEVTEEVAEEVTEEVTEEVAETAVDEETPVEEVTEEVAEEEISDDEVDELAELLY